MKVELRSDDNRQYRGLLLDVGTVILKSFFETRAEFERLLRLPQGSLPWAGPLDPSTDPLWHQVVAGEFSEREYWNRRASEVGALVGEKWTIQDFCRKHGELPPSVIFREEILALITSAKRAGLKLGILSNELELFQGKDWLQTTPFGHLVDGVVDATHTNILKPDPRAFALALEVLDLRADQTVFIDDQPRNVAGGSAAGIRSFHLDVTNPLECIAQARQALGLPAATS